MEDIVVKPMPIISDDVLIKILLKLPLRSLLDFRSVSKHWLYLIQNPSFVNLLTKRPVDVINRPMLILRNVRNSKNKTATNKRTPKTTVLTTLLLSHDDHDDETLLYKDDVDLSHVFPKPYRNGLHLLGPCNGLFCITDRFDVVVLNPTTKRCRKLPQSGLLSHRSNPLGCVGFGFDPVCNDHKVFWFKQVDLYKEKEYKDRDYDYDSDDDYDDVNSEFRGYKVDVFSLSTKRWRMIEDSVLACDTNGLDSYSLFVNRAFHWLDQDSDIVIVFDLNEESFKQFDMPTFTFGDGGDELTMSVLNESLALICHKVDAFEICVMEEYGRDTSWMKLYSFSCVVAIDKPLSLFGQGEEFLLQKKDGKLASFNLNTRVVKDFQVRGVPGDMYAFRYNESLVSLKRCKRKYVE